MKRKAIYSMVFAAAVAAMCAIGTPLRASETDDGILASFKDTYAYETFLKDDGIRIEVKDGVVTLTGTVSEEFLKTLAAEVVEVLPGVTRVDNQLELSAETVGRNEDMRVGRAVESALLFHRNVSARRTIIEVKDGIVTLKGEASSMAQKTLTAEYAKDVQGVKGVNNEMAVVATPEPVVGIPGEKIDNASITAEVKTALLIHRSTQSSNVEVKTRDGEVTLTGIAKNAAEKALVGKLAADIHGVTMVKNLMTVAGP